MKTLHLSIFVVIWIVAFYFSIFIPESVDGTETSNLEVTKNMACAGDIINFSAITYPNTDVEIALGWPNGIIENYTTVTTSDQHGHFFSTIQMPYNAMSGIWKVFGKAGGDKFGFNVSVYSKKENYCTQTHETILESPLKQFKSGIAASKVVCNQGFQLIIKREDGSPACMKPDDVTKLVSQRMWGLPIN